jgi:hypothetical protein
LIHLRVSYLKESILRFRFSRRRVNFLGSDKPFQLGIFGTMPANASDVSVPTSIQVLDNLKRHMLSDGVPRLLHTGLATRKVARSIHPSTEAMHDVLEILI